jgi:precorrin-4/cobalt-precorrin-4 C11-methyltransferase
VGAGSGDAKLITLKGYELLKDADVVLYTGSLIPDEVLGWCRDDAIVKSSHKMSYDEIFGFFLKYHHKRFVRLHTGDPTLYSTLAKQIRFLRERGIDFKVVAGVSAVFGAGSSLGIEYTIPGVSQTLILTRISGKSKNPEALKNILRCRDSSLVFYLSINLIDRLVEEAKKLKYPLETPCWVVEKATWRDEKVYKGRLENISEKVSHIRGVALILLGEFLYQEERASSHLYSKETL